MAYAIFLRNEYFFLIHATFTHSVLLLLGKKQTNICLEYHSHQQKPQ